MIVIAFLIAAEDTNGDFLKFLTHESFLSILFVFFVVYLTFKIAPGLFQIMIGEEEEKYNVVQKHWEDHLLEENYEPITPIPPTKRQRNTSRLRRPKPHKADPMFGFLRKKR